MTNRQEVAKKLRESGKWLDSGDTASIREALFLINQNVEAPNCREFAPLFDRLADLIDPTCHMVDSKWDNGECTWGCICKECGSRFEHKRAAYINYCPRCGARVVRDDG